MGAYRERCARGDLARAPILIGDHIENVGNAACLRAAAAMFDWSCEFIGDSRGGDALVRSGVPIIALENTGGAEDLFKYRPPAGRYAVVVGNERKTVIDHGMEVDRFRVQLMASEHGPVPINDLCGLDAFCLDVGKDLAYRLGRRAIGGNHLLQGMGVVNHRAERLTELMRDRICQRRHRLTAVGISGERQIPSAVQLGPLPCAPLIEEADNEKRLDGQRAGRAEYRVSVFLPQARTAIAHDTACRQPTLRDAPPL